MFFVTLGSQPGVVAASRCEIKVYSNKGRRDFSALKRFFRIADAVLARTIPTSSDTPRIRYEIVMTDNPASLARPPRAKKNTVRLYLPQNLDPLKGWDSELCEAIGTALALKAKVPLARDGAAPTPRWMELGILRKARRQATAYLVYGVVTFPGAHALLTRPDPPDVMKTFDSTLRPQDGSAYKTMMEMCEVALDVVSRLPNGKNAIHEMLSLASQGLPPRRAFRQALETALSKSTSFSDQSVDDWFLKFASSAVLNVFQPGSADFAAQRFKDATLIEYRLKAGKGVEGGGAPPVKQYCVITDLDDAIGKARDPDILIKREQLALSRLAYSLPANLQRKVVDLAAALDKLKNGDKAGFKSAAVAAVRGFNDELHRCHEVERLLERCEKRFVPPTYKYHSALKEAEWARKRRAERWPGATALLDRIEHDMSLR